MADFNEIDELAQFIRRIDGNHKMGAAALAEEIITWQAARSAISPAGVPEQGEHPPRMADLNLEAERKLFEASVDKSVDLLRVNGKDYTYTETRCKWEGWLLARSAMSADAVPAKEEEPKDSCKLCLGAKGGVPGNENVIGGVVVCDYCTSDLLTMKKAGWFGDAVPAQASAAEVVEAAKAFYNATVADTAVRITSADIGKRDAAHTAAERLRAALLAAPVPAQGEQCAAPKLAHGHRTDFYLMANARTLAEQPIHAIRSMPNWVLAKELFATGSTSAYQICRDAGIDPDGYKVARKPVAAAQGQQEPGR